MKKTTSLLLVLILCVSALTACNGVSSNDPNVGLWSAYSVDENGSSMDISDVYKDGATTIELKSNGSCTLFLNGKEAGAKWKLNGTVLTIISGSIDYPGRIRNGVLELEMADGFTLFFSKDGKAPISSSANSAPPDTPSPSDDDTPGPPSPPTPSNEGPTDTPSPSPDTPEPPTPEIYDSPTPAGVDDLAEVLRWWDGDWYGSFYISDTNDAYSSLTEHFEDIYAVIKTNPDGTATVYLWSDGYSDLGTVEIEIEADGWTKMGSAVSTGGVLFNYPVSYIDWYISPEYGEYDNMIEITEFFLDTDGDWFDYEIYLRPWGMKWDDVSSEDRPLYYDDWYLSVYNRPMLDVLGDIDNINHSALNNSSSVSSPQPSPTESAPSPTESAPPPTDSGPPPTDSGPPPTNSGPPPTAP